jgi:hypothetical protein
VVAASPFMKFDLQDASGKEDSGRLVGSGFALRYHDLEKSTVPVLDSLVCY